MTEGTTLKIPKKRGGFLTITIGPDGEQVSIQGARVVTSIQSIIPAQEIPHVMLSDDSNAMTDGLYASIEFSKWSIVCGLGRIHDASWHGLNRPELIGHIQTGDHLEPLFAPYANLDRAQVGRGKPLLLTSKVVA